MSTAGADYSKLLFCRPKKMGSLETQPILRDFMSTAGADYSKLLICRPKKMTSLETQPRRANRRLGMSTAGADYSKLLICRLKKMASLETQPRSEIGYEYSWCRLQPSQAAHLQTKEDGQS
ncbi:hypothetical protein Bbelb_067670 [Branchiostoma belcheri]|nr:hypothetical protein Bbelb_067670 [Branchiostoma belcheri]